MPAVFMHRTGLKRPGEISSSFPHDARPLLGNSVTITKRFRDAGMEASTKYYHLSLMGISPHL